VDVFPNISQFSTDFDELSTGKASKRLILIESAPLLLWGIRLFVCRR
jgi:hypothetical protein